MRFLKFNFSNGKCHIVSLDLVGRITKAPSFNGENIMVYQKGLEDFEFMMDIETFTATVFSDEHEYKDYALIELDEDDRPSVVGREGQFDVE